MSERNPEKKAPEIVSPADKIAVDKGELNEDDLKQVSGGGSALPTGVAPAPAPSTYKLQDFDFNKR